MKFAIVPALVLALTLPAWAGEMTPPAHAAVPPVPYLITPMMAIEAANAEAPAGVFGVFDLRIRATGRQDDMLYLNTQDDYRDQRNVTVDIPANVESVLAAKSGPLDKSFIGKHLHVKGVARRVKIHFLANGEPTEKYYFQTHIAVVSASQVEIVADDPDKD